MAQRRSKHRVRTPVGGEQHRFDDTKAERSAASRATFSLGSVIIGKYSLEMSSNYCDSFPNACEYGVPCPWIPTVGFRCRCGSAFAGNLCDTPTSSLFSASDRPTQNDLLLFSRLVYVRYQPVQE